jgi:cholesterol oxidase
MMTRTYDAVIIGSGFGGSIHALRLTEAGRSVLVLERGRRWSPRDFPRDVEDVDRLLWRYPERTQSRGLFELRAMSGISSITASGVGGGSLIYASIHYRPQATIFADPRWPAPFSLDALEPYYAKVEEELGVAPIPRALGLPKRDAFHRAARAMGRASFDAPLAVNFAGAPAEDVRRQACQLCAECEFGCTYGAKNTLDFTYLAKAQQRGCELATHRMVTHISPAPGGGWAVHHRDTETGETGSVVGRRVVIAAGTLGTNELLLRSRDVTKTLPRLSHRLGHGYSGNGDFLGNIQGADRDLEPWLGPDVTSVMWNLDDGPQPGFAMATPTFSRPVMEALASFGQPPPQPLLKLVAPALYRRLPGLLAAGLRSGRLSKPLRRPLPGAGPASRMTTVFAMGHDNAGGRLTLRRGRLDAIWDYARENRALIARQRAAMQELAEHYGGRYADLPTWELFSRPMTVHNLGGCALSETADEGVVGLDGMVHGHPGLYVADGSVIPTAIGSHPVMTISAVAEWIAERVAASFLP